MNTYVEIATSGPFLDALRQELGLDEDRPGDVKAGIVPETELLNITVEDSDPFLARDAANALSVMIISENPMRDIKITVVDPAVLPESASSMRMILTIILVVLIGLIGGTGLAFLIENLDPRLQTAEQIVEVTGLPVIGQIPDTGPMQQGKFLIDENPHMDSFRRLRINLLNITKEKGLKTLLVTSSQPDEGKSTIAVNLAICLAQTDLKLLLTSQ
jgi:receptor protein-tyrosine kinase